MNILFAVRWLGYLLIVMFVLSRSTLLSSAQTNRIANSCLVKGRPVEDWMKDVEPSFRNAAANELHDAGPDIVPCLLPLLGSTKADQKANAAYVLGLIARDNPRSEVIYLAIEPLLLNMKSSNHVVRIESIQATASFGTRATNAIPVLVQLTKDPERGVRMSAVEALVRVAPESPRAITAIKSALADPDTEVRLVANLGLKKISSSNRESK